MTTTNLKPIDLDFDIHQYLLNHSAYYGEPASDILRRSLHLAPLASNSSPRQNGGSGLQEFLESPSMIYAKGVVGRFLATLGWLYSNHKSDFSKVENIKGRGRVYFARDAQTLHKSGRSVNPKQIPNSPYWVITTTPTNLKQEILASVMRALGLGSDDIASATSAIAK